MKLFRKRYWTRTEVETLMSEAQWKLIDKVCDPHYGRFHVKHVSMSYEMLADNIQDSTSEVMGEHRWATSPEVRTSRSPTRRRVPETTRATRPPPT